MSKKIFMIAGVVIVLGAAGFYLYSRSDKADPVDYEKAVITLERTACYGTCPVYKLTINGNGKVVYEGLHYVKAEGTRTFQISPDQVKALVDKFYSINYFSLSDRYDAPVTDLPTTITSITIGDKTKKVVNYYGAPQKLIDLENKIAEVAKSRDLIDQPLILWK